MNRQIPSPRSDSGETDAMEDVEIKGHIIDSLLLPKVLDEITALGGRFEIQDINVGQLRSDPSFARLRVSADSNERLEEILSAIGHHGALPVHLQDCQLQQADMDVDDKAFRRK